MPHFTVGGLKVELVLLLVTSWSMLRGFEESIVWAVIGGLGLDLFSAAPFGVMMLALAVTSFVLGQIGTSLLRTNPLLPIVAAPIATVVFNVMVAATLEGFGWQIRWTQVFTEIILPLGLLNTIAMVPVYGFLYGIHSRIQPEINW